MLAKALAIAIFVIVLGIYRRRRVRARREAELPTFRDAWRVGKGGRPFLPPEEK